MSKGLFVSFEGIDGVGKTTLLKNVDVALTKKGYDVLTTKEPGDVIDGKVVGSDIGKGLRELLWFKPSTHLMAPGVADLLLLADHIQVTEKVIKPALAAGKLVLCDRYADSQFAYSCQKDTPEWAMKLYAERFELKPDITFLLTCDPETAWSRSKARLGNDGARQEGKVWKGVKAQTEIQKAYKEQLGPLKRTIELDVTKLNPEEIANFVIGEIHKHLYYEGKAGDCRLPKVETVENG